MIAVNRNPDRTTERDMRNAIEPLASFICASDHPKAALNLALSLLVSEIELTICAANARIAAFSNSRWS
jgi:hypothetical protein